MVLAVLVVGLVPALAGVAPAAQAEIPTSGYEQVLDITFPVAGPATYIDDYHQNRGGGARRHQATDVMAAKLQRAHAVVDGVICRITGIDEPMPSWGFQLVICGDDGREYGYVHLNNDSPDSDDGLGGPELAYAPGIRKGVRVTRGQFVGYVGDSGNAEDTAPHVHFSIYDPELDDPRIAESPYANGRINPYPSLEAARQRGDVPGASAEPAPAQPAPAPRPAAEVRRVSGSTRVQTAVALSQARSAAKTVIIAPSASHAEALVAAPLAGLVDAPVLLTRREGLETAVADEVRRLGAVNAYVIGRTDQLAPAVLDDLTRAGVLRSARLAGDDVGEMSAVVAREIASYQEEPSFEHVLVALGDSEVASRAWPDALSGGALAAYRGTPILLTEGDELPESVAAALTELAPGIVQVIGGTGAISDVVADAAQEAAGADAVLERLAGRNRYETSLAVAMEAIAAGLDADEIWLATGRNFPDALAAGPAAALAGAPLLLLDGMAVGGAPASEAWLAEQSGQLTAAVLVGGEAVVTEGVAAEVARLLRR